MDFDYPGIAGLIDHALLSPVLPEADLVAGCRLALSYEVAGVCVLPCFVSRAAEILTGSRIAVGTTVGFPHGADRTAIKLAQATLSLSEGARELDAVPNLSFIASGRLAEVTSEVRDLTELVHAGGGKLKLIFETGYLDEWQKILLCEIGGEVGVDFVKTSTGFGPGGATLADVRLMRANVPPSVGVKASGGIARLDQVLELRPYVSRIGTSKTATILDDCRHRLGLSRIKA